MIRSTVEIDSHSLRQIRPWHKSLPPHAHIQKSNGRLRPFFPTPTPSMQRRRRRRRRRSLSSWSGGRRPRNSFASPASGGLVPGVFSGCFAVANHEEEGERPGGRLQVFLASVVSSIGAAVFGGQIQDLDMASRPIVPRHPRGGQLLSKHNFIPGADRNNRRALEDIGNRVDAIRGVREGKPLLPLRPSNKLNAAKIESVEEEACDKKVGLLAKKEGFNGQDEAKVPKQEMIIDISPDSEQEGILAGMKNLRLGSAKRKVKTVTSVLMYDIDSADAHNQLALVEYLEDLYKFYKHAEVVNEVNDYMDSQTDVNEKMRAILTDWLIEVHNKFELMPETLYLAVYIFDRYLSLNTVIRRELQLVGIAAMLIACKYEEIWSPEVKDFVCICDRAYTREQILTMEKLVLNKLEWSLTVPTAYVFTARFIKAADSDEKMKNLTFFFTELALMHYVMIKFYPSMIAASAVYAARCTLMKSPRWSGKLEHHTGFLEAQLVECTTLLVSYHSMANQGKLKAVYKKYSSPQREAVALLPPAQNMLEVTGLE